MRSKKSLKFYYACYDILQKLEEDPEYFKKFAIDAKNFPVFSNYNDSWISEYIEKRSMSLSDSNDERLVGEINKFLSIDHNYIEKDDLMSKDEIFKGVRNRFLYNYGIFNKFWENIKEKYTIIDLYIIIQI